jgi:tRNA threonylcarbamoyladenosine biosynthesis protein TsaB
LLLDGQVIIRESAGAQTHSQSVLPMVQNLLAEAGFSLRQCDAIAFGSGPGSFTGVRTACGIVQGLAFGASLPVVPVVTLEAMAQACRQAVGTADVLAILDARMGQVYWAQYRYENGWRAIVRPTLSDASEVSPESPVIACGNGLSVYASAFESRAFFATGLPAITPHAKQVAQLALEAFLQGRSLPAQQAQPLYLRNKIALTTAERKGKAAA